MKVSLFITCLSDLITPKVGQHTVELLEKAGCEVDFPESQTCCGQPAFNSGYLQEAKQAMKQTIRAFRHADYVVGPSGSCVGMLKEYPKAFEGERAWYVEAQKLADKSYEITDFLVNVLNVTDTGSTFKGTVTYHPSCHMTRVLGVKEAPRRLLENVQGAVVIDLPVAEDCCGFGGTFAVKNSVISGEMVKEKSRHVSETKAEYLVGGDMGCLLNIEGRMRREGKDVKVVHITEILNYQEG